MNKNLYEPPKTPSEPGRTSLSYLFFACVGYAICTIPLASMGLILGSLPGAIDGTPTHWMLVLPLAFGAIGATLCWLLRRVASEEARRNMEKTPVKYEENRR